MPVINYHDQLDLDENVIIKLIQHNLTHPMPPIGTKSLNSQYGIDSVQYYSYFRLNQSRILFTELVNISKLLDLKTDRKVLGIISYLGFHMLKLNWTPWVNQLAFLHCDQPSRFTEKQYHDAIMKLFNQMQILIEHLVDLHIIDEKNDIANMHRVVVANKDYFDELTNAFEKLTMIDIDEADLLNISDNISINAWWMATYKGDFTAEFHEWSDNISSVIESMEWEIISCPEGIKFIKANLAAINKINHVCAIAHQNNRVIPLDTFENVQ